MRNLLVTLLLSSFLLPAYALSEFQYIVQFTTPKISKFLKKKIYHEKIEVAAKGNTFVVIRPKSEEDIAHFQRTIASISTSREIIKVKKDFMIDRNNFDFNENVQCIEIQNNVSPQGGIFKFAKKFNNQSNCKLNDHCKGKNMQWAKYQVDADIAEKLINDLRKEHNSEERATVAVVDSGFDVDGNKANLNAQIINTAKGFDKAGDEHNDQSGHGTSVSGMISAKNVGITSNVNLNIYRTTEAGDGGSTTSGFLAASIEKACLESDVVNVSWGNMLDEVGFTKIEEELWYEKAKELGCLVMKSSGNAGVKKKKMRSPIPSDAPVIMIGAINNDGSEALFSSESQLKAPGAGVYTLVSNDKQTSEYSEKKMCSVDGVKYGPINGTSFSSPVAAAVAGQVLTVLKIKGVVPNEPDKKLELLKNILKASASSNSNNIINSYKAVKIASLIEKDVDYESSQKLVDLISDSKPKCNDTDDCPNLFNCSTKKECLTKTRENIHLCNKTEDRVKLVQTLASMGEYDVLAGYLPLLKEADLSKSEFESIFNVLWKRNIDGKSVDDLQTAINLLNLAHQFGRDDLITRKKFKPIFNSWDFKWRFNIDTEIGTNIFRQQDETLYSELTKIFGILPLKDQKKIINKMARTNFLEKIESHDMSFLVILENYQNYLPAEVKAHLNNKLNNLSNKLVNKNFINKYDKMDLEQSPIIDVLVKRNTKAKSIIKQRIKGELNKTNANLISYAFNSKQILTKEEKLQIARELIKKEDYSKRRNKNLVTSTVHLFLSSDQEDDVDKIKNIILNNADIRFKTPFNDNYPKTKVIETLYSDTNFLNELYDKSLDDALELVKGKRNAGFMDSNYTLESFKGIFLSRTLSKNDKKVIFEKNKEKLEKLVDACIKTIEKSTLGLSNKPYHAVNILEEIFSNSDTLISNNFTLNKQSEKILKLIDKKPSIFLSSYKIKAGIDNIKRKEEFKF